MNLPFDKLTPKEQKLLVDAWDESWTSPRPIIHRGLLPFLDLELVLKVFGNTQRTAARRKLWIKLAELAGKTQAEIGE